MSVVLMRMKNVPGNCCACELRCHDPLTGEEICPKTGRECLSTGRDVLCPIIGVLPDTHGRLVDADALIELLEKKRVSSQIARWKVELVREALSLAKAIIPATEEEKHDSEKANR